MAVRAREEGSLTFHLYGRAESLSPIPSRLGWCVWRGLEDGRWRSSRTCAASASRAASAQCWSWRSMRRSGTPRVVTDTPHATERAHSTPHDKKQKGSSHDLHI
eukprot:scaffold4485_cov135-Isochrysis_galbana.AAC.13